MTLKDKIVIELLAGKANRDIALKFGCKTSVISHYRKRCGFGRQRPTKYLSPGRKLQIRELWLDDLCCPTIAAKLDFPLDTVINYLQAEGLT